MVAEGDPRTRSSVTELLAARRYRVLLPATLRAGFSAVRSEKISGLVAGSSFADGEALRLVDAVAERGRDVPAVVIASSPTVDGAIEAIRRGAADYLGFPVDEARLVAALERSPAQPAAASNEMAELGIMGYSRPMLELFDTIKRIAPFQSTILLQGESGTGKELFARALHSLGNRGAGPFVAVNCATLSDAILENELFGHEKGAFTSADRAKPGVMEIANGGTLFLDEVSEMGLACQAKLLRALERREFRRVGGTTKIHVELNVIAASNVKLEEAVEKGRFRPDLYYRLKVVLLTVPPLRDRTEGVPLLAQRFLDDIARKLGLPPKRLAPDAVAHLVRYPWPGNVRELRNLLESLTLMVKRPVIRAQDLPAIVRGATAGEVRIAVGTRLDDAERELIARTLESSKTIKEAAAVLGIGLRTLHTKIRRYGLR